MPVNTNVQNAKAILDAFADYLDKTVDNAKAVEIVERFTDTAGSGLSNEEKAALLLDRLLQILRKVMRANAERAAEVANQAAVQSAGDTAESQI